MGAGANAVGWREAVCLDFLSLWTVPLLHRYREQDLWGNLVYVLLLNKAGQRISCGQLLHRKVGRVGIISPGFKEERPGFSDCLGGRRGADKNQGSDSEDFGSLSVFFQKPWACHRIVICCILFLHLNKYIYWYVMVKDFLMLSLNSWDNLYVVMLAYAQVWFAIHYT